MAAQIIDVEDDEVVINVVVAVPSHLTWLQAQRLTWSQLDELRWGDL
jgi:hypothetical protein